MPARSRIRRRKSMAPGSPAPSRRRWFAAKGSTTTSSRRIACRSRQSKPNERRTVKAQRRQDYSSPGARIFLSWRLSGSDFSALVQRCLEGGTGRGAVDEGVVLRGRRAGDELQRDEDRAGLGEKSGDLGLEIVERRDRVGAAIAGGACEGGEIDLIAAGDRMAAIRLVFAILTDEMQEVRRLLIGDGDERAEVHEQAAIAIEHDDALVGPCQRKAKRAGRGLSHRADRVIGEGVVGRDAVPFLCRLIDRHDDLIPNVAREYLEAEIAAHGGALGVARGVAHICLPISSAVG